MYLEGKAKLGYYPTPDDTLAALLSWLEIIDPGDRRYLDPCCGEGEALAAIAAQFPGETYGIELSNTRAATAERVLTRVINCGYENAALSDAGYSLVLLNPPYDGESMTGGGIRMEETFLISRETTAKLVPTGVLIYIIPHVRINERIARHLAGWYENLRCFKLAEGEYEVFKQVVILGAKRAKYAAPDGEQMAQIMAWQSGQVVIDYETVEVEVEKATDQGMKRVKVKERHPVLGEMPYLLTGMGEYAIPASESKIPFKFLYHAVQPEELVREAKLAAARLDASKPWQEMTPAIEPEVYIPAMTPKKGHIALQVSGGLLGTNRLKQPDGRPILIKGWLEKEQIQKIGENLVEADPDDESLIRVEIEERFRNVFSIVEGTQVTVTTNPLEIADLLDKFVGQLAEQLQLRNRPRYNMDPEPWEWAVFDPLSPGRVLAGRKETGLTEFQKHLAIAIGRALLACRGSFGNAEMGSGKAQPLDANVLTPHGWKRMGDIQVGDRVINPEGGASTVVGIFPQGEKDIYRVTFSDGSSTETCADHLWSVNTPERKWRGQSSKTLMLREMMDHLISESGNYRYFIPLVNPVTFESEQPLPVHPYLLGALLGDGGLSAGSVILSTADLEIVDRITPLLPNGIVPKHKGAYDYALSGRRGSQKGEARSFSPLTSALRGLGLMGTRSDSKFIPEQYLFASVSDRVALLQGLLDTDGYVNRSSHIEITTVSQQLAKGIASLVQSLGGTTTTALKQTSYVHKGERRNGKSAYRVHITLPPTIKPFALARKAAQYVPAKKYGPSRAIAKVEFVGRKPAQCIAVDARNQLYVTDDYIVTHNTTIGIAVAEYLQAALARQGTQVSAYPALVMGPGIVTGQENWPKEVREVIPGAHGQVITIGAKPVAKPMKIGLWLKGLGLDLEDEGAFTGLTPLDTYRRLSTLAREQGVVIPNPAGLKHSLLSAESRPPVRRKGAAEVNWLDARLRGSVHWLGHVLPRDAENGREIARQYSMHQFLSEYASGRLPVKSFGIVSFETAKLGSGRVPAVRTRKIRRWYRTTGPDGKEVVQPYIATICTCPKCGGVLAKEYDEANQPVGYIEPYALEQWIGLRRRFCLNRVERRVWDPETGEHTTKLVDCGNPLFEESDQRRTAAADYLAKKGRGKIGLCLVDEVHEAKGRGTGVGWTFGVLAQASRWTVGLTGTLFGGYSTSIFMLWYRLISAVRKEFGFGDDKRWAAKYGLLKRVFYVEDARETAQGAFCGEAQFDTVSEKPGISPAIVRYGLPYCTFSSLKDIGLPLPEYGEEIVRIPMTAEMETQYAEADGAAENGGLFHWALEERRRKDKTGKGAISVWLNTALNRPDTMFRPEIVTFNRRLSGAGRFARRRSEVVRTFPAVIGPDDLLPKEQWLVDHCQAEKLQGRKSLVFVRQTGERDIQERLKGILEKRGLRVGILKPSLAPARRATWIKEHARQFDVLLTNARLVKVGLNLIQFPTAIFYELEWSLYIVWQAMRRLYRPGAPKPVRLYFPVYSGTMEEHAMDLIGAKMTAAMMFYGDEVGGALTEGDEGDLLSDLVRSALGEIQIGRSEGVFSLGYQMTATESAYGSPTAVSPLMESSAWGDALDKWAAEMGVNLFATKTRSTRKKKATAVPQEQLGFFF